MVKRWLLRGYQRGVSLLAGHGLRRFPGVESLHRFVARRIASGEVDVHGHRMILDAVDSLGLAAFRTYEPVTTDLLRELVRPGDVAIDVGAHIGYHALLLARAVGPSGRVIAFEPEPANHALLVRNIELNGYDNVEVVPKAVADRSGLTSLYLSQSNLGDHRLYDTSETRQAIEVPITTLDDEIADRYGRVDFVKVDTQGTEAAVLAGMKRLLNVEPKPKLLLELWPEGLRAAGTDPHAFVDDLRTMGYELFALDEIRGTFAPLELETVLARYEHGDAGVNLYCR